MGRRVKISLEMDSHFVSMLNTTARLGGLREKVELTAADQLALVALAEARGGTEDQVDELIHDDWRGHIVVRHEERSVEQLATHQTREDGDE